MACYRSGGCGPYEMRSCSECPASKPEYMKRYSDVAKAAISLNRGVVVIGNEVTIDGVKMSPCPGKGHNSTIINNKVYLNGYELVNGEWKKTLKALWHKWF